MILNFQPNQMLIYNIYFTYFVNEIIMDYWPPKWLPLLWRVVNLVYRELSIHNISLVILSIVLLVAVADPLLLCIYRSVCNTFNTWIPTTHLVLITYSNTKVYVHRVIHFIPWVNICLNFAFTIDFHYHSDNYLKINDKRFPANFIPILHV
jgi:hypothetical protein